MLRLIEDVCEEDDEQMANSFDHYSQCSEISKSEFFINTLLKACGGNPKTDKMNH